jgi:hypothetical protein
MGAVMITDNNNDDNGDSNNKRQLQRQQTITELHSSILRSKLTRSIIKIY